MRPVIIGAGISGLSCAYYLSKAGVDSILLDPRPRLGGVIQTEQAEGCTLEGGPDSFLAVKPEALALIGELGMASQVISSNDHLRRTYIRKRGRMVPMPEGFMMMAPAKILPLARSPLLSWSTKMRMGLEYFRKPAPISGDISIAAFIEDHYGPEVVDYLAEPLLSGVYGGDPRQLSVQSVLPRFAEMARQYGSLTRGVRASRPKPGAPPQSLFRTLRGGLGSLVDALENAIRGHCEIRQARAEAVEFGSVHARVRVAGEWMETDHVVSACEAHNAAALFTGRLSELLGQIPYSSSIVAAIGFDGPPPMDGFGFLVPKRERQRILACTWVGTKFSDRTPAGTTLARCFMSGEEEPDMDEVVDELHSLASFKAAPKFHRIYRWPRAMAQYTVGHAARVSEIEELAAALPGLHLAGNAYHGIGIPDCIRSGKRAAEAVTKARQTVEAVRVS